MEKTTFDKIEGKIKSLIPLTKNEIIYLLDLDIDSEEAAKLFGLSNSMSRKCFKNRGVIFAQIGLNSSPCPRNCDFCVFGEKHGIVREPYEVPLETVLAKVKYFMEDGVDEVFLMTTAGYNFDKYLRYADSVRRILPSGIRLVANIDDFGSEEAKELERVGFTGAYHISRLREGRDTGIAPEKRWRTLDAIRKSSLELYYCVEPIGPEHSSEELADEIMRGLAYKVSAIAVMRRVSVPGTPLACKGQITERRLAHICAVTRVACLDSIRAMGVHEPSMLSLMVGANQVYAEKSCNPRDIAMDTEKGRGFSVCAARKFLTENDWFCNTLARKTA